MDSYRIISSDSHVVELPDLWTSRVKPEFRDRAPSLVTMEDGSEWLFCDGHKIVSIAAGGQAGKRFDDPENLSISGTVDDVRCGGYIPEEQIRDMDADGVDVNILYPTVGLFLYSVPDSDLLTAVFRAYNDWVSEFCTPYPDRLKGIAMLNVDDVASAASELRRCAKMGLAGAMITVAPTEERPYSLPEYEPLWATAQDMDMPLSLHLATNRPSPGAQIADIETMRPSFVCNTEHWVRMSLADMIFSGVFERYPSLQVGSVEHDASWAPHFLDKMNVVYNERAREITPYRFKEDLLPSDYFRRNVFVSFQDDATAIRYRHDIGVDNIMFGSDYPHPESTFPRTREILEEILVDCTAEEKAKIAGANAARVYHLD